MKAMFGLISLIIVLAVVGLSMARQMKSTPIVSGAAAQQGVVVPATSGTPREQSQQIQKQVTDDVAKALAEGAARAASADQ